MSSDLKILSANIKKNILTKRYKFTVAKTVDIKEIVKEHSKQYIIIIIDLILTIDGANKAGGVGCSDGKYYILLQVNLTKMLKSKTKLAIRLNTNLIIIRL